MESLLVEHHHGLSFCYNLKYGINNNIEHHRLIQFANWFYTNFLKQHFRIEEKHLFPILGMNDSRVVQAINEHQRIESLFLKDIADENVLLILTNELDHHIKFEERHVFPDVIDLATEAQLELLRDIHDDQVFDDYHDKFWE